MANFRHSSIEGYLGCLHIFAIMNSADMNMGGQLSLQDTDFIYIAYISRSGIGIS